MDRQSKANDARVIAGRIVSNISEPVIEDK